MSKITVTTSERFSIGDDLLGFDLTRSEATELRDALNAALGDGVPKAGETPAAMTNEELAEMYAEAEDKGDVSFDRARELGRRVRDELGLDALRRILDGFGVSHLCDLHAGGLSRFEVAALSLLDGAQRRDKPWYPDDRPWKEYDGSGKVPEDAPAMCEVLLYGERERRRRDCATEPADDWDWAWRNSAGSIVAYLPEAPAKSEPEPDGWVRLQDGKPFGPIHGTKSAAVNCWLDVEGYIAPVYIGASPPLGEVEPTEGQVEAALVNFHGSYGHAKWQEEVARRWLKAWRKALGGGA